MSTNNGISNHSNSTNTITSNQSFNTNSLHGTFRYNCNFTEEELNTLSEFNNLNDLITYYYHIYPDTYYLKHPEFTVNKLNLSTDCLNTIPTNIENRTRENIRDWMISQNLNVEDWTYVGW